MRFRDPPHGGGPAMTDEQVKALARRVFEQPEYAKPTAALTPWEQLQHADLAQDIALRRTYAKYILWLLAAQLAFANGMFFLYAYLGAHWDVPARTMQVWLGASVVQVVGVVLVVTRYLFPRRDRAR